MVYNILKTMVDPKTGKTTHVLLNDGLSQISEYKNIKKAMKMAQVLNENSDSGWIYEVRGEGRIIMMKETQEKEKTDPDRSVRIGIERTY